MDVSAVFKTLFLCLELLLVCYYTTVDGQNYNKGIAKGRLDSAVGKTAPTVHLLVCNCLQVPMRYLDSAFEGNVHFTEVTPRDVNASSCEEVFVTARQPNEAIYGFIQFNATENLCNIPITLYFNINILNMNSRRWPWYGIEMNSHSPRNICGMSKVSQFTNSFRKFEYPNSDSSIISLPNRGGMAFSASMCKMGGNHFRVMLVASKVESQWPETKCPTFRNAKGPRTFTTSRRTTKTNTSEPIATTAPKTMTTTKVPITVIITTKSPITSTSPMTTSITSPTTTPVTAITPEITKSTTPLATQTTTGPTTSKTTKILTTAKNTTTSSVTKITATPSTIITTTAPSTKFTTTLSTTTTTATPTSATTRATPTSATNTATPTSATTTATLTLTTRTATPTSATTTATPTSATTTTMTMAPTTPSSVWTAMVEDYQYYGETVPWW